MSKYENRLRLGFRMREDDYGMQDTDEIPVDMDDEVEPEEEDPTEYVVAYRNCRRPDLEGNMLRFVKRFFGG